jgi:hypothetical protein
MLFWNKRSNKLSFSFLHVALQKCNHFIKFLIIGILSSFDYTNGCSVVLQVGRLQDILPTAVTLGLGHNLLGEPLFYPFNLGWCKSSSPSDPG